MRSHRPFYPMLDQGGFTLLELLLVVTILSAVAWMSLGVVNNNSDQVRFEDTRNRLQAIRRAIIGDTSRTLNGQPVISGYVADMGKIPDDINALVSRGYCVGNTALLDEASCLAESLIWRKQGDDFCSNRTYATKSSCETAGKVWNEGYGQDDKYGLWIGWNGPYLQATSNLDYPKFLDGWGNNNGSNNFGWNYNLNTTTGNLTIQSLGIDGGSTGTGVYEVDYPPASSHPLIGKNEYSRNIATATIQVKLAPLATYASTSGLCLVLMRPIGGKIDDSSPNFPSKLQGYIPTAGLPAWDNTPKTITFTGFSPSGATTDTHLYLGRVAYQVTEYDGAACTMTVIGSNNGTADSWRSFYFMPNGTIPTLEWNVP